VALPFGGGALLGMLGGRLVCARISATLMQKGFASLCFVVAIALIVKTST